MVYSVVMNGLLSGTMLGQVCAFDYMQKNFKLSEVLLFEITILIIPCPTNTANEGTSEGIENCCVDEILHYGQCKFYKTNTQILNKCV